MPAISMPTGTGSGPSAPKTPGMIPPPEIVVIESLSDSAAVDRTKTITRGCAPYKEEDLAGFANADMGSIYEFMNNESVLSLSINTIILEGKFVNVTYSAAKMSGDKAYPPELIKIIMMKLLIHTLEINKVNTCRHLVYNMNLAFAIDSSARLMVSATGSHSDTMKTTLSINVPIFDPGKAEDF